MRNLEKGQHIFIAFQAGKAVLDSQLRPRIYTSLENADKCTPTVNKGKIEYVEYAPTLTPPNEPLTIEQLREMDGEPVWVQTPGIPQYGRWVIVAGIDTNDGQKTLYCQGDYTCRNYGQDWLAYRRPAEGEA